MDGKPLHSMDVLDTGLKPVYLAENKCFKAKGIVPFREYQLS
jgi:hypothetical protein